MPIKTYLDFLEVEQDIKDNAPPIVYKYRTWTHVNHKNVLTKTQLWFGHPFDMNDPLDVRPDLAYDTAEIESEAFYQKLLNTIPPEYSQLSYPEKVELAQSQWQQIKADPNSHFNANRQQLLQRECFDQYGILSTSSDCLNIPTWEVYGDSHQGYAIGFNTLELARQIRCTTGVVTYSDNPFLYSFLGDHEEGDILLNKKTAWAYEQEFRFITVGIEIYRDRLITVAPETVSELVLGYKISVDNEKEILAEVQKRYSTSLPIYKTEMNSAGQLVRKQIN